MNRGTFAFSPDDKVRNNVVHFSSRHARDCVNTNFKTYKFRYTSEFFTFLDGMHPTAQMQFLTWILQMLFTSGNSGCQSKDNIHARYPPVQEGQDV